MPITTDRDQGILDLVMHKVLIFALVNPPTFSLRTSILLLASVILAPNRKSTTRHFSQRTPVAPLREWINGREGRPNCSEPPISTSTYLLVQTAMSSYAQSSSTLSWRWELARLRYSSAHVGCSSGRLATTCWGKVPGRPRGSAAWNHTGRWAPTTNTKMFI